MSAPTPRIDSSKTVGFLKSIYAGVRSEQQGETTIWDSTTKHSSHLTYTDTNAIVAAAAQRVIQGFECYYGVGLTRPGLGPAARGTKFDVMTLPAFFLDVDIRGDGHASQALPTGDEAYAILEAGPLEPTLIVHSGGGLHAYWCFEEAWLIAPNETDRVNELSKTFQRTFIDAAKQKRVHVDQTGNIDRVLRLPGTYNLKTGTARLVEVVFEGVRYDRTVVVAAASARRTVAQVPPSVVAVTTPVATLGVTAAPVPTTVPGVVASSSSPALDDIRRRMRRVKNLGNRKLMLDVLAGRAFAAPGNRDEGLQKVASIIAFVLEAPEQADPEQLVALLLPSLDVMRADADDPANPALTREDAVEKLGRALQDATTKRAANKVTDAAEKAQMLQKISSPPAVGQVAGHAAASSAAGGAGTIPPRQWMTPAQRARRLGRAIHIPTGFPTFDQATRGGWCLEGIAVLGGAPGAGKTSLLTQLARRWAKQGIPTSILAADEAGDGLLIRIGQAMGFDRDKLEAGDAIVREDFARKLETDLSDLVLVDAGEDGVYLEDVVEELCTRATARPAVLLVDSIQTIRAQGTDEADGPRPRVNAVMDGLKAAARRGLLVVATSELSRAAYRSRDVKDRIDDLAAFKESGGVEYGTPFAMVLRRLRDDPGIVEASIAKNRWGAHLTARLKLDYPTASFGEVPGTVGASPFAGLGTDPAVQLQADMELFRIALRKKPGIAGNDSLLAEAKGIAKDRARAALRALRDAGEIDNRGTPRRPRLYLLALPAPPSAANSPSPPNPPGGSGGTSPGDSPPPIPA